MDLLVSVLCHNCLQFMVQPFSSPLLFPDPSEHLVIVFRELDALSNWKNLGLQLGLNFPTLSEIEEDEQSSSHRKMAVLHLWLSLRDSVKERGGATKAALVKALYNMKENVLAHRIERKALSSPHSCLPSSELYNTCMSLHIKCKRGKKFSVKNLWM